MLWIFLLMTRKYLWIFIFLHLTHPGSNYIMIRLRLFLTMDKNLTERGCPIFLIVLKKYVTRRMAKIVFQILILQYPFIVTARGLFSGNYLQVCISRFLFHS